MVVVEEKIWEKRGQQGRIEGKWVEKDLQEGSRRNGKGGEQSKEKGFQKNRGGQERKKLLQWKEKYKIVRKRGLLGDEKG